MEMRPLDVLSLRPDPARPLDLDLKQILDAILPVADHWVWCVRNLDWLGEAAEEYCRKVEARGPKGCWITSRSLARRARKIYQTIEGEFLAFPRRANRRCLDPHDLDLGSFPSSRSIVAIVAVDGCYFDLYSKDGEATKRLMQQFPQASFEDAALYF